jgi:hypothetical protein
MCRTEPFSPPSGERRCVWRSGPNAAGGTGRRRRALTRQCETVSAWHRDNDLPLLSDPCPAPKPTVPLARSHGHPIGNTGSQSARCLGGRQQARRHELSDAIDLGFASQRWQGFVGKRRSGSGTFDRWALEVCVFVHLADALQTGESKPDAPPPTMTASRQSSPRPAANGRSGGGGTGRGPTTTRRAHPIQQRPRPSLRRATQGGLA